MNKRMMTKLNGGMKKNQCQRGRAARAGRGPKNNAVEKDSVSNPVSANVTLPSPK